MKKERDKIEDELLSRFLQALDLLVESERLKSRNAFCQECGLAKSFLSMLASNQRRRVPMYALYHIIQEYRVSANWLIIGLGDMFLS